MPRLILFNGPPSSGKDTVARAVAERIANPYIYKMTSPMDAAIQSFLGLDDAQYQDLRENRKDQPLNPGTEVTFRDVLIQFSENWSKPMFGDDIFGKLAAYSFGRMGDAISEVNFVITDSGFAEEAVPLLGSVFRPRDVLHFHLHREGYTFEGDSRGYWSLDGVEPRILFNNGSIEETASAALGYFPTHFHGQIKQEA